MEFIIPDYVKKLLNRLEDNNLEAFVVGGSVRDALRGSKPADYDIATNAMPEKIEEVFKDFKTIGVGKEFGTIVVVQREANVEITTYRTEEDYRDGRRPSNISFTTSIEEDLKRRDFTINAMAFSEEKGLIDPFGGKDDLKRKTIKTVGDPRERFLEDHLRILRGIRLSTTLDFKIEEETLKASKEMGVLLERISSERIREEFFKILLAEKPSVGIELLRSLDILELIIPEIIDLVGFDQHNPYHSFDVYEHTLCVVDSTPPILEIRLAALFHDIGKADTFTLDEEGIGHFYGHQDRSVVIAGAVLKRLKASNNLIEGVNLLIKDHMTQHNDFSKKGLKRLINRVGKERILFLLDLQEADMKCTKEGRDISIIRKRKEEIEEILRGNEPVEKKQLAIDGNDIVKLGYKEGRIIGSILEYLLEIVLDDPKINTKEELIKLTLRNFKK